MSQTIDRMALGSSGVLSVWPTGRGGYEGQKKFVYLKWASRFWLFSQKFYWLQQGTSKRDERRALGYMGVVATTWVPRGA